MAEETQYLANTGFGGLNLANSGLDGSGTINNIFFATTSGQGSFIKTITIKCFLKITYLNLK